MKPWWISGIILLLLFTPYYNLQAQTGKQRPKIGLTLSGGGAKGLAHIGILKAIDSAGLQIDYVTGTSMGAIVGSLYAIGYSGDSILQIARNMDWNVLLSNRSSLQAFIMEEKNEYGRYALELPMENGRFRIPSGVLEAEELWLKFNELYNPVYGVKDFNQFKRPFKCIATDLETGDAVVLDRGDLISAVRSSMAIPSVFTAVELDGKKLVDGGLIRNFPVSDVRNMGAEIVIGSSVSSGLLSAEKITSPVQILMQIAFFKEANLSKQEVALTDYYIEHPVSNFTAGSFNSSDSILAIGLQMGDLHYPYFKKLADSLNAIYGPPAKVEFPLVREKVTIRHIINDSLRYITKPFLRRMLGLKEGSAYTVKEMEDAIRQAYGTRYFNRLYYQLEPVEGEEGVADMHLIAEENAPVTAKLAVHFNTLSDMSLIVNLSFRDYLGKQSRTSIGAAISENFRFRAEHSQVFGTPKVPLAWISEYYFERQEFPTYNNYKASGLGRELSTSIDTRLQLAYKRRQSYALGIHWERASFKPLTEALQTVEGRIRYLQGYLRYEYNSHDRLFLPRRGTYTLFEPSIIFAQQPNAIFYVAGEPILNIDSIGLSFGSFARLRFQIQKVIPIRKRSYLTLQGEAAGNFNASQFLFHDFLVGGMKPIMRNQVSFAGIQDAALTTNSLIKGAANWRYQITGAVYTALTFNLMYTSFLKQPIEAQSNRLLSGYAFTLGIDSPIGPLEFSLMYGGQSRFIRNYVNLGFRFSRQMF
ncbi:patatin-like phospholipase family protein [Flavihumibacter sp. RY-1]|uniref:Patatin-like phospholipase family protein n=1 Tax=Flavihumibacter fluminis TaxID=2909236 RepID=A0ABS9BHG0_9BACT|nr:patatin-like phospholipase family protein [Flavihumibacter fluminis]MCF1715138.1 patatin-like phospholipase family protein [Flavihumibacter fluminis]